MPSLLDDFQPAALPSRSQAMAGQVIPQLMSLDPAQRYNRGTIRTAKEQVSHYTEWNYVSIAALAWRFSQLCPYTGTIPGKSRAKPNGRQRLSYAQAQNLKRNYPRIIQSAGHQEVEPLEDAHPFARLISSVNAVDWWQSFAYEFLTALETWGRAYIWLLPSNLRAANGVGNQPAELHVIPATWVEPYFVTTGGEQTGWVITPEGDTTRREIFPLEWVEFCRYKSPLSKWDGFSPMTGGSRWIENAESIELSRNMQFRNGGNPDLLVTLDGEVHGNPNPELITRIKESVMQRASGLRRHGEPLIAPPGVKYEKWSATPREMDYETSANQARDAVLALRGVPKVLFGITEDVNRASIEGANIIFGQNLNPKAAFIAGFFTERVAPRFGPGLCMWFDDAVPTDSADEREEVKIDLTSGAMSPDERRIQRGREPWGLPAAETGYLPSGMVPLDPEAMPEPPAPEPGADTGQEVDDNGDPVDPADDSTDE
jgi:phage portal protein BeeE